MNARLATPFGASPRLWLGRAYHDEARAAYARARAVGLTSLRALVIGSIASFKDCWAHRRQLARHIGCSVRTVQRAITQAKAEGLIGVAHCKVQKIDGRNVFEQPPGADRPVTCGWSHRWTVGWGKAGAAVKQAVEAARARFIVRAALHAPKTKAHPTLNVSDPAKTEPRWKRAPDGREWRNMDPDEVKRELDSALERMPRGEPPG